MASTQTLTELPSIHYTGMDYNTVISQIREIIENNSNWASNWTQFYNSEAGTMLIQLMAWVCDTLGVRQDLLYNEMFMSTASTEKAKRRLLNLVGYTRQSVSAASIPIAIQFDEVQGNTINLSNVRDDENDISSIVYNIYKFYGKDKNGDSKSYEILDTNSDGTINYTKSIKLAPGLSYYTTYDDGSETPKQLKAVEGSTVYREFTSDTSDGPSFVLEDSNIDLKTLVIYDVTNNQNILHQRVENFLDLNVLNGINICYTISMTDDGYYQINYPTLDIVTYGSETLEDRLFTAGNTIGVLYRTASGDVGNIASNYISVEDTAIDATGVTHNITITNILSGSGGKNEESMTSALKNYAQSIKTMNRAITITDYDTLLKQNDLVLNCKSYSPDNMPSKFKDYFGRRINPQEVFSFVILNKAFEDIPSDSLNYFPWVELNKDQVLNEKYVFGDAVLNSPIQSTNSGVNVYIKEDSTDESALEDRSDGDGSNFYEHYNFKSIDEKDTTIYNGRQLPNATLYKTSSIFGDYVSQELNNIAIGKSNPCYLKIKFSNVTSDENYVKNMTNSFLDSKENLMTNNNVIKQETNATYVGSSLIPTIDYINYKYLDFVLDDNLKFIINLQGERQKLNNSDDISSYYMKFSNDSSGLANKIEEYEATLESNSAILDFENSYDYANYRKGLIQQIRDQIDEQLNYIPTSDATKGYTSETYETYKDYFYGSSKNKKTLTRLLIDNNSFILTNGDDNNVTYNIGSPKTPSFVAEDFYKDIKAQDIVVSNRLSDGSSAYIDLGLKAKTQTDGDYLFASFYHSSDQGYVPYSVEKLYKYYTVKINGEIYALRIDAQTATLASNFYTKMSDTQSGSTVYNDYYPYIGTGTLISGSTLNSKLTSAFGENWITLIGRNANTNIGNYPFSVDNTITSKAIDVSRQSGTEGIIKYYSTNTVSTDVNDTSSCAYVSFSVEQLAIVLEYLLSIFNNDTGTVYKYTENGWADLKATDKNGNFLIDNGLIANGKIRVSLVKKDNFSNEHCLNLPLETTNKYSEGKEYDIRFSYFNMIDDGVDNFTISSVADSDNKEIKFTVEDDNGNDVEVKIIPEDLIQSIFSGYKEELREIYQTPDSSDHIKYLGYKRQYSASAVDYRSGGASSFVTYGLGDEDGYSGYLYINSLATGKNSSLYFIQTASSTGYEFISYSGLFNGFGDAINITSGAEYAERAVSEKAYGIKRVELVTEANINSYIGADKETLKAAGYTNGVTTDFATIDMGDILITDNDINHSNLSTLYFSYVLNDTTKLLLDQRNNFYYSSDEETNENAKPPIVCIEGAAVQQNDDDIYYIDKNKSNFDVRLTADEQDTNSLYTITQDSYSELETIKVDRVRIETASLSKIITTGDGEYSQYGINYGIEGGTVADYEVPLVYSIDGYTSSIPTTSSFTYSGNKNNVIAINPGPLSSITGSKILNKLLAYLKESDIYGDNYYAMAVQTANDSNRFILNNLLPTGDGNITFYYPNDAIETLYINSEAMNQTENPEDYFLACKVFYLHLFGTSLTNPEFYALYPKDEMTSYGINSSDVVQTISDDEYFYCPTQKNPLKFVYRKYISSDKTESAFGDWYITAESKVNDEEQGFKGGYYFYLNKTTYANFPDINFYVHYINDRTYEYDRTIGEYQTEEDILANYMDQYKITGMDSYFIKPYFKTFDIVGTVNYNANYDVATIKSSIDSALKAKYSISNISDFTIGKEIYRSDVFKVILGVEGVESVSVEYFGYNYADQENNPDQKYVLTTGASDSTTTDDFYIIPVLHDTESNRGIVLIYSKVATSNIYSN